MGAGCIYTLDLHFVPSKLNKAVSLQIKICVNPFREMIRIPSNKSKNNNKDQV